jgi:hypothetical protein
MARTSDKLKNDMQRVLSNLHAELDRVEFLAAALDAFSAPVPDYEPVFRHLSPPVRELDRSEARASSSRGEQRY